MNPRCDSFVEKEPTLQEKKLEKGEKKVKIFSNFFLFSALFLSLSLSPFLQSFSL